MPDFNPEQFKHLDYYTLQKHVRQWAYESTKFRNPIQKVTLFDAPPPSNRAAWSKKYMLEICLFERELLPHDAPLEERLKNKDYRAYFSFRADWGGLGEDSFADVYKTSPKPDFWEKEWMPDWSPDSYAEWKSLNKNDCWLLYDREAGIAVLEAQGAAETPKPEQIRFKPGQLSDAARKRAKELKPTVEKLYELTIKEHRPLMSSSAEDCLRTAQDILEDDPVIYSPISKDDLTTDLFTENPSSARRDFVGILLQRLLRKEGFTVSNYQSLYREISGNN